MRRTRHKRTVEEGHLISRDTGARNSRAGTIMRNCTLRIQQAQIYAMDMNEYNSGRRPTFTANSWPPLSASLRWSRPSHTIYKRHPLLILVASKVSKPGCSCKKTRAQTCVDSKVSKHPKKDSTADLHGRVHIKTCFSLIATMICRTH